MTLIRDEELEQKLLDAVIADRNSDQRTRQKQLGPSQIGQCRELIRGTLFDQESQIAQESHYALAAHVGTVLGDDLERIFGERLGVVTQQRVTTMFNELGVNISGATDMIFVDSDQISDIKSIADMGSLLANIRSDAIAIDELLKIKAEGKLFDSYEEVTNRQGAIIFREDGEPVTREATSHRVKWMNRLSNYIQLSIYVVGAIQSGILNADKASGRLVFVDRSGDYLGFVCMVLTPEMIDLFFAIAQRRLRDVVEAQDRFEIMGDPSAIHHLRDKSPSWCFSPKVMCFEFDEEVLTRQGHRRIGELSGGVHELLVPSSGGQGEWRAVPVREYGRDEIVELHLRRGQRRKVVKTTAAHQWFVDSRYRSGPIRSREIKETVDLRKGDKLRSIRKRHDLAKRIPFAQAQGFVFGDGSASRVSFHPRGGDKMADVMPLFVGIGCRMVPHGDYMMTRDIPSTWKHLPGWDESGSFLLSWLSGYFAADGSVTKDGTPSIASADRSAMEFVRSALWVLGVRTGQVREDVRDRTTPQGTLYKDHVMYELTIRGGDLPDWFFMQATHRERSAQQERNKRGWATDWIVDKIVSTGRIEPVYCAEVPDIEAFALADGLLTHNCPRRELCWGGSELAPLDTISDAEHIRAIQLYKEGRDTEKLGAGMKRAAKLTLSGDGMGGDRISGRTPDGEMVSWDARGYINVVSTGVNSSGEKVEK